MLNFHACEGLTGTVLTFNHAISQIIAFQQELQDLKHVFKYGTSMTEDGQKAGMKKGVGYLNVLFFMWMIKFGVKIIFGDRHSD